MKKVILLVIISLISGMAFAQTPPVFTPGTKYSLVEICDMPVGETLMSISTMPDGTIYVETNKKLYIAVKK